MRVTAFLCREYLLTPIAPPLMRVTASVTLIFTLSGQVEALAQTAPGVCETATRQMIFWCAKERAGVTAGMNCGQSKQSVDERCYGSGNRQLVCMTAQTEIEFWCRRDSSYLPMEAGMRCGRAQEIIRTHCL